MFTLMQSVQNVLQLQLMPWWINVCVGTRVCFVCVLCENYSKQRRIKNGFVWSGRVHRAVDNWLRQQTGPHTACWLLTLLTIDLALCAYGSWQTGMIKYQFNWKWMLGTLTINMLSKATRDLFIDFKGRLSWYAWVEASGVLVSIIAGHRIILTAQPFLLKCYLR